MALSGINITIGQSLGDGQYNSSLKGASAPVYLDTTAVDADVTQLVTDAGSPTQDHVNTLATDWSTLSIASTALTAAITGDVSVQWNSATITKRNQLLAALRKVITAVKGGYGGLAE
jgi:hypothetical protein